jgi:hypothetical protein
MTRVTRQIVDAAIVPHDGQSTHRGSMADIIVRPSDDDTLERRIERYALRHGILMRRDRADHGTHLVYA